MQTNIVVTVTGSVIRPESRFVDTDRGGQQVTSWSMAQNDWKDKDNKDKTIWVRVSAWGRDAELIEKYCTEPDPDTGNLRARRGAAVQVTGQLSKRSYTDRNGDRQEQLEVRPFSGSIRLMNERTGDENGTNGNNGGSYDSNNRSSSRRAATAARAGNGPSAGAASGEDDPFGDIPF